MNLPTSRLANNSLHFFKKSERKHFLHSYVQKSRYKRKINLKRFLKNSIFLSYEINNPVVYEYLIPGLRKSYLHTNKSHRYFIHLFYSLLWIHFTEQWNFHILSLTITLTSIYSSPAYEILPDSIFETSLGVFYQSQHNSCSKIQPSVPYRFAIFLVASVSAVIVAVTASGGGHALGWRGALEFIFAARKLENEIQRFFYNSCKLKKKKRHKHTLVV